MAVTGLIWLGFLVGSLGTNVQLFGGSVMLNDYYASLKSSLVLFWGVRVVLATSVMAHVAAAVQGSSRRPQRLYRFNKAEYERRLRLGFCLEI